MVGLCCLPESVRAALQIGPQRPPVTVSVESLEKACSPVNLRVRLMMSFVFLKSRLGASPFGGSPAAYAQSR